MEYAVTSGEESIGKAQVEKEGLYYHIRCRCLIAGNIMSRLEVTCDQKNTDLGILVPLDSGFGLETRIPVNKIGKGELKFRVLPKNDTMCDRIFVPIKPEEPFRYLSRLRNACLEIHDGKRGIRILDG